MVNGQLTRAVEQLRERFPTPGCLEDIVLFDPLPRPRQIPAALAELVAQLSEFLLVRKQLPPGSEPLLT